MGEKVRGGISKMISNAMYSSNSDEWETPQSVFDELDAVYHFDLDVCATVQNAKCSRFFDKAQDGLKKSWGGATVWCNPPYSKVADWVRKASEEQQNGTTTVMLVPSRTDTKWFHAYCYEKPDVEIRFIKGRLKFGHGKNSAPFPSMIVIFRGNHGTERTD